MTEFAGYFPQPTVIKTMSKEMITIREETFAPVVGYTNSSLKKKKLLEWLMTASSLPKAYRGAG